MPITNCPPGNNITDAELCAYLKAQHEWMKGTQEWMVATHKRLAECCPESPEGKLSTEPTAMAAGPGVPPPGDPPGFPP